MWRQYWINVDVAIPEDISIKLIKTLLFICLKKTLLSIGMMMNYKIATHLFDKDLTTPVLRATNFQ